MDGAPIGLGPDKKKRQESQILLGEGEGGRSTIANVFFWSIRKHSQSHETCLALCLGHLMLILIYLEVGFVKWIVMS